jgi:cholinesterase
MFIVQVKLSAANMTPLTPNSSDCPQAASKPVDFPGFTPQAQGIINAFAGGAGTPQSEDCLTLNIWAPSSSKRSKKQDKVPVLVFFHGGREYY